MSTAQELHPIIRPPQGYVPASPVRDDAKLGAHEDLDRDPDGVPHSIVGMTAFFSIVLAMLVAFMFVAGGTFVRVLAVLLPVMAIPVLVSSLNKKSNRERDRRHPSR